MTVSIKFFRAGSRTTMDNHSHVYVLLGQSNTGDGDSLDCIGVDVFTSLEDAKTAAQERANSTGDRNPVDLREGIHWEDDTRGGAWADCETENLEIRRIRVHG